jgi:hypothetical protein
MADDEAAALARLRIAFERAAREQRFGLAASWRTVRESVRAARDVHLPLAFGVLSARCGPNVPVPIIDYPEFVTRMRSVIGRHVQLGFCERMLFGGWARNPHPRTDETRPSVSRWFKPVLGPAA